MICFVHYRTMLVTVWELDVCSVNTCCLLAGGREKDDLKRV